MVVIAIIGILAAIAMPSISNVRAKARDSKRLADLNTFKTALEMYFSDHGEYPIWTSGCLENTSATSSPFLAGSGFVPNYMRQIPKDPLYGKGHCFYYKTTANGSDYYALAFLEKNIQASQTDGGSFDGYYEVYSRKEKLEGEGGVNVIISDVELAMGSSAPPGPPISWTVDGLTYTTRRKITIDQLKVDDNLTDFPVLVKLTTTNFDFSKANADGYDIRFTSSDGTTLLKYERERHDSANSLAEYWVKVPTISGTVDTDFYIYYRTTDTADGADQTNVWDANFKGVWHSKDITTSTINDSTAIENNGTKKAVDKPIEADGKIGKAQSFDGSDDYIVTAKNVYDLGFQGADKEMFAESWIYLTATPADQGTIVSWGHKGADQGANRDSYLFTSSIWSNRRVIIWNWGMNLMQGSQTLNLNEWYHVVCYHNITGLYIYVNGELDGERTDTDADIIIQTNSKIDIGRVYDGTMLFKGKIDEIRVSNVTRSAAWIKADYNSGNDSLLTYGAEEIK